MYRRPVPLLARSTCTSPLTPSQLFGASGHESRASHPTTATAAATRSARLMKDDTVVAIHSCAIISAARSRMASISQLDRKMGGAFLHRRVLRGTRGAPELADHGDSETSVDHRARRLERRIVERNDHVVDQLRIAAQRRTQLQRPVVLAQAVAAPILAEIGV